ncbi:acyl-CoA thioesterase [Sporolactobacillus shoreae]|uniref:Acyl-CoA thioesterase n=1 Tax=Sporolactobacillus shoreae TaxID=1465501 RepID=A0A4Z0GR38_9BACL|nr:acyl-CoA thioesterase [Sporolactobacillus shoreae]TGA99263.1 acyl-CoA thioesterase [Sporolactobacillus shoreae]
METSRTRIVARYNETDKMGIIHHSQYVNWFEVARTDWIRQSGLSFRQIEERGLMMPVIGIEAHYHLPAKYDDAVIVETSIQSYDSIKMSFNYRVIRESDGALLVDGVSSHCFTDDRMHPVSLKKKDPELNRLIAGEVGLL